MQKFLAPRLDFDTLLAIEITVHYGSQMLLIYLFKDLFKR